MLKLEKMARIGYVSDLELVVWTDDSGNVPHFHLRDRSTEGDEFNTCIRLDKPEYFHHTGKEGTLNSKQRNLLVEFLSSYNPYDDCTYWELIVKVWNMNNSSIIMKRGAKMPDYRRLPC